MKKHDYFAHDADIGIIGRGNTKEEAFVAAAEATFAIMSNLEKIKPSQTIFIDFEEIDLELALVIWLNQLLGHAHELGLVFSRFELHCENNCWHGTASGEPWTDDLRSGTEVKGATLTMLKVAKLNSQWEARCVVDV